MSYVTYSSRVDATSDQAAHNRKYGRTGERHIQHIYGTSFTMVVCFCIPVILTPPPSKPPITGNMVVQGNDTFNTYTVC